MVSRNFNGPLPTATSVELFLWYEPNPYLSSVPNDPNSMTSNLNLELLQTRS